MKALGLSEPRKTERDRAEARRGTAIAVEGACAT